MNLLSYFFVLFRNIRAAELLTDSAGMLLGATLVVFSDDIFLSQLSLNLGAQFSLHTPMSVKYRRYKKIKSMGTKLSFIELTTLTFLCQDAHQSQET